MIRLIHVNKYFNRKKSNEIHVINETSLELGDKGLVTFLGSSGCGKTTLLNAIGGLDKVDGGDIYIDDERITTRDVYKRQGVVSYAEGFDVILNTFRTIMLAAVLIVLFFITYFITKLILKSRNVYFSTIRMLGATKENCSGLLKTELFTVFNIAFFICLGFFLLVKSGNINSEYLTQLASFLGAGDFVLLYICLLYTSRCV